jgi:medium-chain acyl-[acyl-carrier-protein] hydrolase
MFREWNHWCKPGIEVVAVELPGRGGHSRKAAIDQMDVMIEQVLAALDPLLDKPYALFGHSMGALIVFELARAISRSGRRAPLHLFISGMRAPHIRGESQMHTLPDGQLIEALRALNKTSAETSGYSHLLEFFLPLLRDDMRLAENYCYTLGPPLAHPITVFGGLDDGTAPPERMSEWKDHTHSTCTLRLIEGDHFFIEHQSHLVVAGILKALGTTLPEPLDLNAAGIRLDARDVADPALESSSQFIQL